MKDQTDCHRHQVFLESEHSTFWASKVAHSIAGEGEYCGCISGCRVVLQASGSLLPRLPPLFKVGHETERQVYGSALSNGRGMPASEWVLWNCTASQRCQHGSILAVSNSQANKLRGALKSDALATPDLIGPVTPDN